MWKDFQLAYTLEGHEQSVWAVLALEGDEDLVLTGELDLPPNVSAQANRVFSYRCGRQPRQALEGRKGAPYLLGTYSGRSRAGKARRWSRRRRPLRECWKRCVSFCALFSPLDTHLLFDTQLHPSLVSHHRRGRSRPLRPRLVHLLAFADPRFGGRRTYQWRRRPHHEGMAR